MSQGYLAHLGLALYKPRASLRRVLDNGAGLTEGALMAVAGTAIRLISEVLIVGQYPDLQLPPPNIVTGFVLAAAVYLVLVWGVHRIGRAFQGKGTLVDVAVAVGWASLITAIIGGLASGLAAYVMDAAIALRGVDLETLDPGDPLMRRAQMMINLGLAAFMIYCQVLWLFAAYIAEAHRFRTVWGPLAVTAGLGVLLLYLAGSAGIAPGALS